MSKYLTDREFGGIIGGPELVITDDDPSNRGRYRVLIPELMGNCWDDGDAPIFCANQVTKYRDTRYNAASVGEGKEQPSGFYGQYFPLHPGTKVIVKFCNEDYQSGYIDRIIGDYYENSLPMALDTKDRDQYYQLLRTVDDDLIAITCDTISPSVPSRSMYFYHKKDNVKVTFDDKGIHIYTKQASDTQITKEAYVNIGKGLDIVVGESLQIKVGTDNKVLISGNSDITINGNSTITVGGNCDIKANGLCNIQASKINMNCGFLGGTGSLASNTLVQAETLGTAAEAANSVNESLTSATSELNALSDQLAAVTDISQLDAITSKVDGLTSTLNTSMTDMLTTATETLASQEIIQANIDAVDKEIAEKEAELEALNEPDVRQNRGFDYTQLESMEAEAELNELKSMKSGLTTQLSDVSSTATSNISTDTLIKETSTTVSDTSKLLTSI